MSVLKEKVAATERIVNRKIHEEFTLKDATLYGGCNLYSDMEGPFVLELDSTVETVYGSQEGAEVGYNPQKPGRSSYPPQLCRERRTGLTLWSRLRRGNTVSANDFVSFLEENWQVVPKRFKKRRRGSLLGSIIASPNFDFSL